MPMEYFDPDNIRLVDKHCKGCVHLTTVGGVGACDYIGGTGHCRPCPPGKDCTEKKVARKKKEGIVII